MPGMNERKRMMRGEGKTARGDYGKKGYGHGGDVKKMALGGALDVSGQLGGSSRQPRTGAGLGRGITGRPLGRRGPAVRRTKADDRGL